MRGSRDFESLQDYRRFIDEIVGRICFVLIACLHIARGYVMRDYSKLILRPAAVCAFRRPLGQFDRPCLLRSRTPLVDVPSFDAAFRDAESQTFDRWVREPCCFDRRQLLERRVCEFDIGHIGNPCNDRLVTRFTLRSNTTQTQPQIAQAPHFIEVISLKLGV